jgi:hypothetical protein
MSTMKFGFLPAWPRRLSQTLNSRPRSAGRYITRPRLEALEDRTLLAGAVFSWIKATTGSWTTPGNWMLVSGSSSLGYPDGPSDTAEFPTVATDALTVNIPASTVITVNTIDFNGTQTAYNISALGSGTTLGQLAFGAVSGSAIVSMEQPVSGNADSQQISAPVVLNAPLISRNNTPDSNPFITATLEFSGPIAGSNGITGHLGITKLDGTDTYTGPTVIDGKDPNATPALVVGGSLTSAVTLTSTTNGSLNGTGTVNGILAQAGAVSPSGHFNSVGTLTSNAAVTFSPGSTYTENFNQQGQADMLSVPLSTVDLGNGTTVLNVVPSFAYAGTVGKTYRIIHSNGLTGFFQGLPDGTNFTTSTGFNYTINYTSTDVNLTVNNSKVTTTTTFTSSPNPSSTGQDFTLTAHVTANSGSAIPTGTVTFQDEINGTILGTQSLDASGNAVLTVTGGFANPGGRLIFANYNGTSSGSLLFAGSIGAMDQQVTSGSLLNPTVSVVGSPNPVLVGSSVTFTATITPPSGSTVTPTGSVDFFDGSTLLGTSKVTTSGGVSSASFSTTSLAVGTHSIQAVYRGDTNRQGVAQTYNPAANTTSEVVNPLSSSTSVSGSPNPSNLNDAVTFTAIVSSTSPGTPTGTVTFLDGSTTLGTGTLSLVGGVDQATFTTSSLTAGAHTIVANYGGDTTFATSSGSFTQLVNGLATTTTVSGSPNPANFGTAVTFTAVVSTASGTPTGIVTFLDGSTTLGTGTLSLVGGVDQATFTTTTNLSVGSHTITASYGGDATFASSSGITSETINSLGLMPTSTVVSGAPNPATFGTAVTFTAIVSASSGTPTGTVTFTDGSTTLGTSSLMLVGGVDEAVFTTSTSLSVGTHTITATYNSDPTFASSAGSVSETINSLGMTATSTTVSGLPNPSTFGQSIVFTAIVSSSSGTPTGTVTFFDGTNALGTTALMVVAGMDEATFTTSVPLSVGAHTITATYNSDASFASSSGTFTQTVNSIGGAATTTSVTGAPNPATFGQSITLTAVVSATGGGTPTGTVTFMDGSTLLGTSPLALVSGVDQATFTVSSPLSVGSHTIIATYNSDATFASSSGSFSETVVSLGKSATTTTASGAPNPATLGQQVILTAIVSASSGTPTGTVTFFDGSTMLGIGTLMVVGGVNQATFATSAPLSVGTHTITATYNSDANFASSSGSFFETINNTGQTATTTTVTGSPNPSNFGVAVTFTAVVTTASGTPTGSVSFFDGGTLLGTATLAVVGGVDEAVFTTTHLIVGPHSITASYTGDATFAPSSGTTTQTVNSVAIYATGADAGGGPEVKVFDAATGLIKFDFFAYDPAFMGGVRVAVGDVNGDGVPDIITAPGPSGGPDIRVFDGVTGQLTREFLAYTPAFLGGVFVAVGDVNGDGVGDIITGADAGGGPEVRVFSGTDLTPLFSFFAYTEAFTGGVRVAAGDVNGDGLADIITGAGPGGGPHVEVFSGKDLTVLHSFFAYTEAFTGGVYVAAGDINGDGHADVITGAGAGGGPHVEAFSGADNSVLQSFMAYDPGFLGGVRVGVVDSVGAGFGDIITAAGPGGGPHVKLLNGTDLATLDSFFAYTEAFTGGVFVGGVG